MSRGFHEWFSLSRTSYLVIPRLALEAMPMEWQERMVALLDEATAAGLETPNYKVFRSREGGKIAKGSDPWKNYRRGNFLEIHGKPLREVG